MLCVIIEKIHTRVAESSETSGSELIDPGSFWYVCDWTPILIILEAEIEKPRSLLLLAWI